MTYKLRKNKTCADVASLRCSNWIHKNNCTSHEIRYDIVYNAVLADIQKHAVLALKDEQRLIDRLRKQNADYTGKYLKQLKKSINESKIRIQHIDKMIKAIYEDKVSGIITVDRFMQMSVDYEQEQTAIAEQLKTLQNDYIVKSQTENEVTSWIDRIKSCLTIDTLTRPIIMGLIDVIELSEIPSETGKKQYDIHIKYRFGV